VQEALRMVLEPIFEADFDQHSFGFRPNRRTQDAIQCIMHYTTERKKFFWIIEGDISSYFDTINHRKLMKLLRQRIKDERVLDLIWKFLRAGVMERKLFKDTLTGAPQGGILSPLLANIYLNELDAFMRDRGYGIPQKERTARRRKGLANFGYARYEDDFVVMCNGTKAQAEAFKQELHEFLGKDLRLELSMEKTKVTHLNDGFDFLGFHIKRCMSSKGVLRQTFIPKEALRKLRHKITYMTSPATYGDSDSTKIMALNRLIGGWCRYYQYTGRVSRTFSKVNHWLFWSMTHWFAGKYRTSIPNIMKRYKQDSTFASGKYRLMIPTDIKSQRYQKSYKKPNPYTTDNELWREKRPDENAWSGREPRPGLTDLKPLILERDNYTCQYCGTKVTEDTAHIDHKKPFKRFKMPVNANRLSNLATSCRSCNQTKSDRQMESRIQGNLYVRFGAPRSM
jgi:RNA-directed DNA polymerase